MKPTAERPRGLNPVRLALLLATMFTLFVAMMFRTSPILTMAATLCAVVLCATPPLGTGIARFLGRGLAAQRQLPISGQTGDIIGGRLRLENRGKSPALLIHLQAGQAFSETRAASSPAVALVSEAEYVVPVLRDGESVEFAPRWLLQKRGVFQLAPVMAGARDPLGIFLSLSPRTSLHEIVVMPRPLRLERLRLAGGARSSPQASQHANITAEALDFHGVRPWRAGEPIRRVHWKSTARLGELHIVEWEDSPGSDISVVFDANSIAPRPDGDDEAFESAIVLLASVGAHCLENGYRFQFFCAQNGAAKNAENASAASREYSLVKFGAASSSETTDLLHALAYLQPLAAPAPVASNATSHASGATPFGGFGALAESVSSLIGRGAGVLLVGGVRSDFGGAMKALASSSAQSLHAIAFDDASFLDSSAPREEAAASVLPDDVTLVRADDSLSQVLEQLT